MNIKIKPYRYYKRSYDYGVYSIYYIGVKYVYQLAYKNRNSVLVKHNKKKKIGTIKDWKKRTNHFNLIVEELTKNEAFLELL